MSQSWSLWDMCMSMMRQSLVHPDLCLSGQFPGSLRPWDKVSNQTVSKGYGFGWPLVTAVHYVIIMLGALHTRSWHLNLPVRTVFFSSLDFLKCSSFSGKWCVCMCRPAWFFFLSTAKQCRPIKRSKGSLLEKKHNEGHL